MKTIPTLLALAVLFFSVAARAQNYKIVQSGVVEDTACVSPACATGGTMILCGSGVSAGGVTTLAGGTLGLRGVTSGETAGAPLLRVTRVGANVVLSWPDPSTGWYLQTAAGLPRSAADWIYPDWTPSIVGGEKRLVLTPAQAGHFHRLVRP